MIKISMEINKVLKLKKKLKLPKCIQVLVVIKVHESKHPSQAHPSKSEHNHKRILQVFTQE